MQQPEVVLLVNVHCFAEAGIEDELKKLKAKRLQAILLRDKFNAIFFHKGASVIGIKWNKVRVSS